MLKQGRSLPSRILVAVCVLALLAANFSCLSVFADEESRLSDGNLLAYYSFEDGVRPGTDVSGNNRHLIGTWGYSPVATDSYSGDLNLGVAVHFGKTSSLAPAGLAYNTRDFLDDADTYTLSMFYRNTEACEGGALFCNNFWAQAGVMITVNKWPDPSATGQVEMYLDYNYIDTAGAPQAYRGCVKFIPDVAGKVDTDWHHVALTVDTPAHTIRMYYDGEQVYENSNMNALSADCQQYPFAFGARVDPQWPSADLQYDGDLDEIRIYNFAATGSEVAELAKNSAAAETGWEIDRTPKLDDYDLYTYTLPYWKGDTVYQEQMLVVKDAEGTVPVKSLMYPATEILSVRSHDLKTVYQEGKDYVLTDGKLSFPEGSSIPMMAYDEYYPSTHTEGGDFDRTGGGYILYSEYLQQRQISITYKHNGKWSGTVPSYQGTDLPSTIGKLENKEPLKIVYYGDSNVEGYCSGGFMRFAPYTDPWAAMVTKMLRAEYGYGEITAINTALASQDSVWGVDDANLKPRVIDQAPDLVVLGFGGNDGTRPPAEFRSNLQSIIDKVRAVHPNTEFLLISCMLPNQEVSWLTGGNYAQYQDEMLALQQSNTGVAVARITDAFRSILENKDYCDVSGNNGNHGNDFTVRLYAQTVLAALYPDAESAALAENLTALPATVSDDSVSFDLTWNAEVLSGLEADADFTQFNAEYTIVDAGVLVAAKMEDAEAGKSLVGTEETEIARTVYKESFGETLYSHYAYRRVHVAEGRTRAIIAYAVYQGADGVQHSVFSTVSTIKATAAE